MNIAPITITNIQRRANNAPAQGADVQTATQLIITSTPTNKNAVSFSGDFINSIGKSLFQKRTLKKALDRVRDLEGLKNTLESINNPKKILKVLAEDPWKGDVANAGKTTFAQELIFNSPQGLKMVSNKLKSLGINDPLNEVIRRSYNMYTLVDAFPEAYVKMAKSLLKENKDLIKTDSAERLKKLADDMMSALKKYPIDEKTCDEVKDISQKITNEAAFNNFIIKPFSE